MRQWGSEAVLHRNTYDLLAVEIPPSDILGNGGALVKCLLAKDRVVVVGGDHTHHYQVVNPCLACRTDHPYGGWDAVIIPWRDDDEHVEPLSSRQ